MFKMLEDHSQIQMFETAGDQVSIFPKLKMINENSQFSLALSPQAKNNGRRSRNVFMSGGKSSNLEDSEFLRTLQEMPLPKNPTSKGFHCRLPDSNVQLYPN